MAARRQQAHTILALVLVAAICALPAVDSASAHERVHDVAETEPAPSFELTADGGVEGGDELVDRRTESSRTYATDLPGVYQTVQWPRPVNFQDTTGAWQEIDASLSEGADGSLHTVASEASLTIADDASEENLVTVDLPAGGSIGFGVTDAATVAPVVDGATATFDTVAEDTTLELTALGSGVKEAIVLGSSQAPTEFTFPLQLEGVEARREADGSISYLDANGTTVASTPAGFMTDSSPVPQRSDGVSYSLIETEAGTVLDVQLDEAWLADPARTYPVTVDPTTYTQPLASLATDIDDTYVVETPSADRSGESVLRIGRQGTAISRAYLHFSDMDQFANMNILQARLDLTETGANTCSAGSLEAYRVDTPWIGSAATAYPGPLSTPSADNRLAVASAPGFGGGTPCASSGTVSVMITPAAWDWSEGLYDNNGIMLKASDEGTTAGYRQFASADDSLHPPTLELIWSDPTAEAEDAPYAPSGEGPTGLLTTAEPTMTGYYEDPQAEEGHVEFFVYNASNYNWGWVAGDVVPSGSASTHSAIGSPLPQNVDLVMRAVAEEGAPVTSGAPHPHSALTVPARIRVPSTRLVSPVDGQVFDDQVEISATAPATLNAMSLTRVDFVLDGNVINSDTSSPYAISGPATNLPTGEHTVEARAIYGSSALTVASAPATMIIENPSCPIDDPAEDNDTRSTATEGIDSQTGVVCASDADWYSYDVDEDEYLQATLTPQNPPGDLDLALYNSAGVALASSASEADSETLNYEVQSDGTYYFKVYGHTSTDEDVYELRAGVSGVEEMALAPHLVPSSFALAADPTVFRSNGMYYVFSTGSENRNINLFNTDKLDRLRFAPAREALPVVGSGLERRDGNSTSPGPTVWAPTVARFRSSSGVRWVMYYTANVRGASSKQCIGYAYNTTGPGGSYSPSGQPAICQDGRNGVNYGGSIDPHIMRDTQGRPWLTWKNDGNCCGIQTHLWILPLNASSGLPVPNVAPRILMSYTGGWEQAAHPSFRLIENPALVQASGRSLLFYSGNDWRTSEYATGYGECAYSPDASASASASPFVFSGCVKATTTHPWLASLNGNATYETADCGICDGRGPGGLMTFQDQNGEMWAAYHGSSGNDGGRRLFLNRMTISPSGVPQISFEEPFTSAARYKRRVNDIPIVADTDGDGVDGVIWYHKNGRFDEIRWEGQSDRDWHVETPWMITGNYAPVAGDFDSDGTDDILWYGRTSSDSVRFGSDSGGYSDSTAYVEIPTSDYRLAVGDFNNDTYDDVILRNDSVTKIMYGQPRGGSGFSVSANLGCVESPCEIPDGAVPIVGNFGGSGKSDVLWYDPNSSTQAVWIMSPNGTITASSLTVGHGDAAPVAPLVGHFTGPSVEYDQVYFPATGGMYTGSTGGTFTWHAADEFVKPPVVGNFDGRGADDILFWASSNGERTNHQVRYGTSYAFVEDGPVNP
jgi:hypothetical protein